jgi:hypothetical protein
MRWYADPDTALLPTAKVKADTRAWRAGADRILGFWEDKLIADRDACILTTEMLDAFNSWLKSNGHNEWSKELFGPRFAQHSETARHGVEATRSRQVDGLSRFGFSLGDLPTRPKVYQGVRFQTASDQEKQEGGHSGHTSSETFSYTRNSESFPKGVSTVSNGQSEAADQGPCPHCDQPLSTPNVACLAREWHSAEAAT